MVRPVREACWLGQGQLVFLEFLCHGRDGRGVPTASPWLTQMFLAAELLLLRWEDEGCLWHKLAPWGRNDVLGLGGEASCWLLGSCGRAVSGVFWVAESESVVGGQDKVGSLKQHSSVSEDSDGCPQYGPQH